jgi:hypothetical protein
MVMGLRAIRMGNRRGFYGWIGLTALLGAVFIGGQYIEYSELGHLGISLDKQDFTVATNVFETVNHVGAEASDVTSWTYDADTEAFTTPDEEPQAVYEIEDLREIHQFATVLDIPENLTNATILLPAGTPAEDIQTIPNAATRNLTVLVGDILTYHVDFEDNADLFNDVDLSVTEINSETQATIEPLLIEWDKDFILLDTAQAAVAEDATEDALIEISDSLEALGIRQSDQVPLSRLGVVTAGGETVSLKTIIEGTAVDLAPDQYDNLNAYFRALIGDSASGYGMRFYAPTAFHGAHVAVGVLWALLVLWRGYKGYYDKNAIGLEMFGLYWHFVDVVWIVLFTLIYLV